MEIVKNIVLVNDKKFLGEVLVFYVELVAKNWQWDTEIKTDIGSEFT